MQLWKFQHEVYTLPSPNTPLTNYYSLTAHTRFPQGTAHMSLHITHLRLHPHSDGTTLNVRRRASCPRCILRLCLVDKLEHSGGDRGPLDRKGGQEHVECNTSVAIATKECHQKPKTNKDHHMYILEDCWGEKGNRGSWQESTSRTPYTTISSHVLANMLGLQLVISSGNSWWDWVLLGGHSTTLHQYNPLCSCKQCNGIFTHFFDTFKQCGLTREQCSRQGITQPNSCFTSCQRAEYGHLTGWNFSRLNARFPHTCTVISKPIITISVEYARGTSKIWHHSTVHCAMAQAPEARGSYVYKRSLLTTIPGAHHRLTQSRYQTLAQEVSDTETKIDSMFLLCNNTQ